MKVLNFLVQLRNRNIQVWAEGNRLRCSAPAGALTPELRDELRQRKKEVLLFLRSAGSLASQQRAIIPLQPRGTSPPIFAVAGHNGDVFCFRALARCLGEDQPFFGLQPPGLDGQSQPFSRVEDLAEYFADQIQSFLPDQPCVIAGYCAGGTIAFELAQQLLRQGRPVSALALFGSPFPTWYRFLPQARERLAQLGKDSFRHARALAPLSPREQWTYFAERLRVRKIERAARLPLEPDPVLIWRDRVGNATLAAIRRYAPTSFPGRLLLYWPSPAWHGGGDALGQWPSIAPRAETHFGPEGCDGATMLREPYAAAFASLFKDTSARTLSIERIALPKPVTASSLPLESHMNAASL